ncbi:MAG: rod shape-determining protein, partial [Clostridiales bacterium]|nr:rod shape-determining protein [Clostridiales bacterium]
TTLPQTTEITSAQIYEAIREPCMAILGAIKWVLERTPPELAADVMHNGIYLTGGGSLLYGMDQMIASELGIPVMLAKEPMECAVTGLGNVIENYELLENLGRTSFLKTI